MQRKLKGEEREERQKKTARSLEWPKYLENSVLSMWWGLNEQSPIATVRWQQRSAEGGRSIWMCS